MLSLNNQNNPDSLSPWKEFNIHFCLFFQNYCSVCTTRLHKMLDRKLWYCLYFLEACFNKLMPYPWSHFYVDINFGNRLYSKEKRPGSPLLFSNSSPILQRQHSKVWYVSSLAEFFTDGVVGFSTTTFFSKCL